MMALDLVKWCRLAAFGAKGPAGVKLNACAEAIVALEQENARLLVVNDLLGKQLVTAWDQLKAKETVQEDA